MFRDLDEAELHVKRNFHSLGSIHPLEKQRISLWRNAKVNCEPRNGMIIENPDAPCMEYLPTKLVDFWGKCRDSYSSTMEHLGND